MKRTLLPLLLLLSAPALAGDVPAEGEIVLEHSPLCESFVVLSGGEFHLLEWVGGLIVFAEGDRVAGALDGASPASLALGADTIRVRIDGRTADPDKARDFFFTRCGKSLYEPQKPAVAALSPPP
jgi:hypothetical protein